MSELEAAQATLADEHAAVYVYGLLGGRTSQSRTPDLFAALRRAFEAHRSGRDLLVSRIRDLGGDPEPAAVAYDVGGSATPQQVRATALAVEKATAAAYAALVAAAEPEGRPVGVAGLAHAAVRQIAFGGEVTAFPGADELAAD